MKDAIDHYHSFLKGSLADDASATLREGTIRHNLAFGSRPICTVLRPMFINSPCAIEGSRLYSARLAGMKAIKLFLRPIVSATRSNQAIQTK